jgi:ASC-1-like (ASCH) protein
MAIAIEERRKGMESGDKIVFTSDNLGVTAYPLDTHTVRGVWANAGDQGVYVRDISDQLRSPD